MSEDMIKINLTEEQLAQINGGLPVDIRTQYKGSPLIVQFTNLRDAFELKADGKNEKGGNTDIFFRPE